MAEEAKDRGNAAFSVGRFEEAIRCYSEAINLSPTNHVLYSNRSAAHASLHQYAEALADAKKTVEHKLDWSKVYSRLGAAHVGLGSLDEAIATYKKGLEFNPNNEGLKSGLAMLSQPLHDPVLLRCRRRLGISSKGRRCGQS